MDPRIRKVYSVLIKEFETREFTMSEEVQKRWEDPFLVMVSAVLSARTKDSVTIKVMERFAEKIHIPEDLDRISENELRDLIYPVGFYRNKAANLKKLPGVLNTRFNGRVPQGIDDLLKLPGVGRKSANLIRSTAFSKPGICVDTHVHRIMNRLGFVRTDTPLKTERSLRRRLDKDLWIETNRIFVSFGQRVCTPVSPYCSLCQVNSLCRQIGVARSR